MRGAKNCIKNIKCITNHDKNLSNCLKIILKMDLKLNTKQTMENDSKY